MSEFKSRPKAEISSQEFAPKIKNILETLEKINYTNWIIVELDGAKISRDFLKEAGY